MTKVAAVQLTSSTDAQTNLERVDHYLSVLSHEQVQLAVLPEDFACLGASEEQRLSLRETFGRGRLQTFLSECAKKYKLWLVGGTIPLKGVDANKSRSSTLVFDDNGICKARYDKVHLFDVSVADQRGIYRESLHTEPGTEIVVLDSPLGRLGLAVCYDLRFPELFRRMHRLQVDVMAIPAAFTAVTGRAHWEVLLRARAIENLSYVIAAAQWGKHMSGRETYGDSMVVSPWGDILARRENEPGVITADLDFEFQASVRKNFPAIEHAKLI